MSHSVTEFFDKKALDKILAKWNYIDWLVSKIGSMSICLAFVVAGKVFQRLTLICFLGTAFSSRPHPPLPCILGNDSCLCKVGIKCLHLVTHWTIGSQILQDWRDYSLLNPFIIVTEYLQFGNKLHLSCTLFRHPCCLPMKCWDWTPAMQRMLTCPGTSHGQCWTPWFIVMESRAALSSTLIWSVE